MRASEGAAATAAQRLRVQAKAPPPAAARRRWLLPTGALSRPATVVARSTTSKHRPAVTRRFRALGEQGGGQAALRLLDAPPSMTKLAEPPSMMKLAEPPSSKKSTSSRSRCPASAASASSSAFVAAATAAVAAMSDIVAALRDAVVPAVLHHARRRTASEKCREGTQRREGNKTHLSRDRVVAAEDANAALPSTLPANDTVREGTQSREGNKTHLRHGLR